MWEHIIGTYLMVSAKVGFPSTSSSCKRKDLYSRMCQNHRKKEDLKSGSMVKMNN